MIAISSTLSFTALVLLLVVGFALLALTQDQHRRAISAPPLRGRARTIQRIAGYVLVALALPLALWRDGPGFGTLLWACLLSVAACAVTFTLSWRPRWLAPFARRKAE